MSYVLSHSWWALQNHCIQVIIVTELLSISFDRQRKQTSIALWFCYTVQSGLRNVHARTHFFSVTVPLIHTVRHFLCFVFAKLSACPPKIELKTWSRTSCVSDTVPRPDQKGENNRPQNKRTRHQKRTNGWAIERNARFHRIWIAPLTSLFS